MYQEFRSVARPQLIEAEATQVLVEFLKPREHLHKAQEEALNRLNAAPRHLEWDPSLVIKALADLDIAFFDGRLRGNVIAVWATEEEILEKECKGRKPERVFTGLCQTLEPGENEGEQRCKVWLISDQIFVAPHPRLQMWETMFHELVASIYRPWSSAELVLVLMKILARLYPDQLRSQSLHRLPCP